jgi:hypothetical protein
MVYTREAYIRDRSIRIEEPRVSITEAQRVGEFAEEV